MPLLPRILAWLTTIVLLGGAWAANSPSEVPTSPSVESGQNQPTIPAGIPQTASEEFTVDLLIKIEADIAEQAAIKAAEEAAAAEAARLAEEEAARQAAIEAARPRYQPPPPTPVAWDGSIHAHPWMVCTRKWESDRGDANGNGLHDAGYQAFNADGPYLGAYQFLQSTWNSTAAMAGRSDLIGVDPREASVADQDQMAWTLSNGGTNKGPWGGRC